MLKDIKNEHLESCEKIKYIDGVILKKMALGGAARLRENADEVNRLNVFPVPDGDTGDNMRMTIEGGTVAVADFDGDDVSELMEKFSRGTLLGARGNSGVILSQFFAGISSGLSGASEADPFTIGNAFELGVKQAYSAVMKPTEGTILTVVREGTEYAVKRITAESTINDFFADLITEMKASLDRTPDILPVLKEAGVVDSGGAGLLYIMDGFYKVLCGENIEDATIGVIESKKSPTVNTDAFDENSEMTYGYCTEFLLRLRREKCDISAFDVNALKSFLEKVGDSIVAFRNDSIVKVHVHTFTPDKVLEYCLKFGDFLSVKIENMSLQHTELDGGDIHEENEPAPVHAAVDKKKYGIVAVSNGDGISELFLELGCDEIVNGGQTQNPSTNDFLNAFEKVHAEHIFVFPNNGNILLAAKQASELYDKAEVHVIESKNIGAGYVALASMDLSAHSPNAISAEAKAAMKRVTTGNIAPAIRDAKINGVRIYTGDTIGIIDKEIVIAEKDRINTACKLAQMLLEPEDKSMLTVFCGKDATSDERFELERLISEKCPDAEVYFNDGGQDVYPFIFVAE